MWKLLSQKHQDMLHENVIDTDLSITKHRCQAPREILLNSSKTASRVTSLPETQVTQPNKKIMIFFSLNQKQN